MPTGAVPTAGRTPVVAVVAGAGSKPGPSSPPGSATGVRRVAPSAELHPGAPRPTSVPLSMPWRRRDGAIDGVVVASVGTGPARRGDSPGSTPRRGSRRVEIPLHRTLVCFQGAFDALGAAGGTMVLLVPTLSLVGAAGFGPWAAVTEGQRALAKAAARAWGRAGDHRAIAWPCPPPCSTRPTRCSGVGDPASRPRRSTGRDSRSRRWARRRAIATSPPWCTRCCPRRGGP